MGSAKKSTSSPNCSRSFFSKPGPVWEASTICEKSIVMMSKAVLKENFGIRGLPRSRVVNVGVVKSETALMLGPFPVPPRMEIGSNFWPAGS